MIASWFDGADVLATCGYQLVKLHAKVLEPCAEGVWFAAEHAESSK